MAPAFRPTATSNTSSRSAQPSTARPPLSPMTVNAYPERCLAPRLMPVSLPQVPQHGSRASPHTFRTTAYAPPHSAIEGRGMGGALHLAPGPNTQAGTAPVPNASHVYYPSAYAPANMVPAARPPSYATATSPIPSNATRFTQAVPVAIPKPRYSTSPPTPASSPPRPAVASARRKRTSADDAQHGASPTT